MTEASDIRQARSKVGILILGAGSSRRMRGRDKLLELVDEIPILALLAKRAIDVSDCVAVTLPDETGPRAIALTDHPSLSLLPIPNAQDGMSASLKAGALFFSDALGIMILPGDMPEITARDLGTMIDQFRTAPSLVHRATTEDGRPGHPVVFPNRMLKEFSLLKGDIGARALLQDEDVVGVPLPDHHATTDLDTPEAWDAWRLERSAQR